MGREAKVMSKEVWSAIARCFPKSFSEKTGEPLTSQKTI